MLTGREIIGASAGEPALGLPGPRDTTCLLWPYPLHYASSSETGAVLCPVGPARHLDAPGQKPREASTLIFKIRSCTVKSDLENKAFSADFVLIFKIRSYNARSDLKNKSARFSGNCPGAIFVSQLPRNYPHRRGNFERGKSALSCGGETVWEEF